MRDVVEFRPRLGDRRCHARRCATPSCRSCAWARRRPRMAARISPPSCGSPSRSARRWRSSEEFHTVVIRSTVQPGTVEEQDRAHPRARQRQRVRRRFRSVLPARVPARRHFDPRLRSSAVHHRRRQLRSGGRMRCAICSSTSMRGSSSTQHSRGRGAQDELQRLSCAQDHLRQRNRPRLAGAGHRLRTKSCAWFAPTSA